MLHVGWYNIIHSKFPFECNGINVVKKEINFVSTKSLILSRLYKCNSFFLIAPTKPGRSMNMDAIFLECKAILFQNVSLPVGDIYTLLPWGH